MAFQNEVVGGTTLVREAIRSANYVPGVSGWSINRDGSAEFATGTFRGPVVIIDPSTGVVLASIGATGNASFQNVNVANDIILGDISLKDFFTGAPRGIVGQFRTTSNLPASGVSGTFIATCWTSFQYFPGRRYRITTSASQWINTNAVNNQDFIVRVVLNQPGVSGGANNFIGLATRQSASGGESQSWNIDWEFGASGLFVNGAMTVALQMTAVDSNAWNNFNPTGSAFTLTVEDVGPVQSSVGGTGAPSGALTWTVQYPALQSRSYDGNGNFIGAPDGNNNMYRSTFPDRPFSNEQFECIFNGAQIRTDLAGASVIYARLYLYCMKCEEASGTLEFGVTPDTAVQGTLSDNGAGSYGIDDDWPVPGWNYYDMLSQGPTTSLAQFLSVGNGIIGRPSLFGLAATGFVGVGGAVGQRPYIEIRYSGNAPGSVNGYGVAPYGVGGYGQ